MEILKTTDKYSFYKEGEDYILDLGNIKNNEDTSTKLLFIDTVKLSLSPTCGCTVAEKKMVEQGVEYTITYNRCDSSFSKVISCSNNNKSFKIKIKGTCQK